MNTLLVVTSDVPFGELIRQKLEQAGRFHVRIARDLKSAVFCVKEEDCPLVFLDTCLPEDALLEIAAQVRRVNSKIRFVIISEAGWHSVLEELSPEDYLPKPFYLPNLLAMMDNLFPSSQTASTPGLDESSGDPPWLSDVTRAAQHLTRLSLGSSAQAALITRNEELWAYAGQLPQSATQELTETVLRFWGRQVENDLVRFIRLTSTEAEHMLYATRLTKDMVLALIFDAETPFSTIRAQASQLVASLSAKPGEKPDAADRKDNVTLLGSRHDAPWRNSKADGKMASGESLQESNPDQSFSSAYSPKFNRQAYPVAPVNQLASDEYTETENTVESPAITWKSKLKKREPAPDILGETTPIPFSESARKIILEPVSASVYNLDYACLLVPRFTQHHLIGDLSECLSEWVQEICIAFAWRLEYISVRPEYLLWIVNVPPTTSPGYLMRIQRQHTSEKIFSEFSRFTKENPSGDFWAPGYLIMGGSQPPPVQLIKDFIAQTRQRQGYPQQFR